MDFIKWPKIPRLENDIFHITEKIDGTNACIVFKDGQVAAQSRQRFVTPDQDNYGFARWVYNNAAKLFEDLGEGHHFGEWWGQGIQRGYGLTEKRFSLFNPTKQSALCHNIPILTSCGFEELSSAVKVLAYELKEKGSVAVPGFINPEGMVIYGEQSKVYWKVIMNK